VWRRFGKRRGRASGAADSLQTFSLQTLLIADIAHCKHCSLQTLPKPEKRAKNHDRPLEGAIIDTALSPHILQFIRANFPVNPVASVPELCLHKAGPTSALWRLAEMDEDFATPYWAYDWGGGLALARHILNLPEIVAGRAVLDLGAGSGIVGIAAAKSGAKQVIAADIDRYALAATDLNAAANGVAISTVLDDLTAGSPPAVDVVLVGDLFYEQDLARRVTAFLGRCRQSDVAVLIGDPWRAFLPRTRLQLLAEYPGADFGDRNGGEPRQNAVFTFK
jgi:predicted nicotinamide N-methyase